MGRSAKIRHRRRRRKEAIWYRIQGMVSSIFDVPLPVDDVGSYFNGDYPYWKVIPYTNG